MSQYGTLTVFGCGHPDRGDDAAGILVARELAAREVPGIDVYEFRGDPVRMLALWPGLRHVIVVDAVVTGAPAGTVHRFKNDALRFADERFATSSHGISLKETVALAKSLDQLPCEMTVIGIEGAAFEAGEPASEAVKTAVVQVVESIAHEYVEARATA